LLTISIANTKKNWVAAVTTNTKSSFKGVGKWGSGEMGKLAERAEMMPNPVILDHYLLEKAVSIGC
jgi:hypothetical protein